MDQTWLALRPLHYPRKVSGMGVAYGLWVLYMWVWFMLCGCGLATSECKNMSVIDCKYYKQFTCSSVHHYV